MLLVAALTAGAIGAAAQLAGHHDGAPFALWGALIAVAVLVERWRYRSRETSGDGDWQATDERFIDPETGHHVKVLYNPRTGARRYEPDPHA